MNKFSWYDAKSVEDALEQVTATVSQTIQPRGPKSAAVLKSGGIDLLDLMKEGLSQPGKVVNIKNIPGLDQISFDAKTGLRLGANVTLAELEAHVLIKKSYLALHLAVAHAATPQLRNMSTIAGNLAQRTRCWYFRSADHECLRKGSGTCYARIGENAYHAIMKNGACASVHASSVATALMAFGARVEITDAKGKREVPLTEFFVLPGDDSTRENILQANEIITAVIVPPVSSSMKSFYIKQGERESYDWALADVAVVLEMSGKTCKNASVVLGAAAPVPLKSKEAEMALTGKAISEETAKAAAEASMQGATPLSKNGYKIPLFKAIVKRAILKA
jgi:xanthine dehydrogenase YagS FAD-binding subunit